MTPDGWAAAASIYLGVMGGLIVFPRTARASTRTAARLTLAAPLWPLWAPFALVLFAAGYVWSLWIDAELPPYHRKDTRP